MPETTLVLLTADLVCHRGDVVILKSTQTLNHFVLDQPQEAIKDATKETGVQFVLVNFPCTVEKELDANYLEIPRSYRRSSDNPDAEGSQSSLSGPAE